MFCLKARFNEVKQLVSQPCFHMSLREVSFESTANQKAVLFGAKIQTDFPGTDFGFLVFKAKIDENMQVFLHT